MSLNVVTVSVISVDTAVRAKYIANVSSVTFDNL